MRILSLLALAFAAFATTVAPAAAPHRAASHVIDWTRMVAATPEGGIRMGNPAAKVKLVEFFSFTCPHCAAFAGEAFGPIASQYVKGGQVSFELRSALRDRLDYVAAQVARCGGPAKAIGNTEAIMAAQADWESKAVDWDNAHRADFQAADAAQSMKAMADAAGLTAIVAKQGVPPSAFARCIGDKATLAAIQKTSEEAWGTRKISGTPGFLINDQYQDNVFGWAQLEPLLQAALKG